MSNEDKRTPFCSPTCDGGYSCEACAVRLVREQDPTWVPSKPLPAPPLTSPGHYSDPVTRLYDEAERYLRSWQTAEATLARVRALDSRPGFRRVWLSEETITALRTWDAHTVTAIPAALHDADRVCHLLADDLVDVLAALDEPPATPSESTGQQASAVDEWRAWAREVGSEWDQIDDIEAELDRGPIAPPALDGPPVPGGGRPCAAHGLCIPDEINCAGCQTPGKPNGKEGA